MQSLQQYRINKTTNGRNDRTVKCSLKVCSFLFLLAIAVTGCTGIAPLHLQNHYPMDANSSEPLKALPSSQKVSVGVAIAQLHDSEDFGISEDDIWLQMAARVKDDVGHGASFVVEEAMFVENFGTSESLARIQKFGRESQVDTILVVLTSGEEVTGPARFDLLPEVHLMNGRQIDHHATVELGLVDAQSGKLLLQVQGNSYATLDELDVPIDSTRYPRVKGSAMSSYIYPNNKNALKTLRAVALDEALQQATMKLHEKIKHTNEHDPHKMIANLSEV